MNDIGICILTLEVKDRALDCLASLYQHTRDIDFEIVLVDNDSKDGTIEAVRARFPAVKLIANRENVGYARAVNQGLKSMDARYYVLLNPDAILVENALKTLVDFMDAHPEAGLCTPKVLNRDGSMQYQCRRGEARPWEVFAYFSGLSHLFPKDSRFTGYLLTHLDDEQVNEVKAISGSCMVIRREVVDAIGYLDERYFAYQEDADYSFMARKAGWKVYYVPFAKVVHYGGLGGSRVRPYRAVYEWHRSYYLYYNKNLARDYPFWFHPLYYLAMLFKLFIALVGVFFDREKVVGTRKP